MSLDRILMAEGGGCRLSWSDWFCLPTNCPLSPVDPQEGTEQAQEQGHLQEDQEQEVGAVQTGPVGGCGDPW